MLIRGILSNRFTKHAQLKHWRSDNRTSSYLIVAAMSLFPCTSRSSFSMMSRLAYMTWELLYLSRSVNWCCWCKCYRGQQSAYFFQSENLLKEDGISATASFPIAPWQFSALWPFSTTVQKTALPCNQQQLQTDQCQGAILSAREPFNCEFLCLSCPWSVKFAEKIENFLNAARKSGKIHLCSLQSHRWVRVVRNDKMYFCVDHSHWL